MHVFVCVYVCGYSCLFGLGKQTGEWVKALDWNSRNLRSVLGLASDFLHDLV